MAPAKLVVLALAVAAIDYANGQALMGVDLGSNEVKVATIKNAEFSIVLNEASKRKSVNALGFDGDERLFGEGASAMRGRLPKNVILDAHHLLAIKPGNPITKNYGTISRPVPVEAASSGGGVVLTAGDKKLAPEEVVGMSLHYMAAMTKAYGKHTEVGSCVVAVPPHFTKQARAALVQAAQIAGLRVVKVINDNTAVALQYARDRSTDAKDETVLFIDVGAAFTSASIAHYHTAKGGKPVVTVKAVAWDEQLGGRQFDLKLADYLADAFDKQTGFKIRENLKSYTKLLNAAAKAKMQLSANEMTVVSIGSLMNDIDFQLKVDRKQLDELCSELYAQIAGPVTKVLAETGLKVSDFSHVVPFGGGWRIPGLKKVLEEELSISKLDTILNSDEAAAFGAVYIHGNHSGQLKVGREIILHDATVPPTATEASKVLAGSELKKAKTRHEDMCKAEEEQKRLETAKSTLEAWIYSVKEKTMEDEMEQVASEEELSSIRSALEAGEEWLYDEGEKTTLENYAKKKAEIESKVSAVILRYEELLIRPAALQALKTKVDSAMSKAKDWATTRTQIPSSELERLKKLATETKRWMEDGEQKLQGEGLKKTPPFTTAEVQKKIEQIKDVEDVLRMIKPKSEL